MQVSELPDSVEVVTSAHSDDIAKALAGIIGNTVFRYAMPIRDAPRTGRVLLLHHAPGSVSLPRPVSAQEMSQELKRLLPEARFDPAVRQRDKFAKGWQVRRVELDGKPAAVVWAAWVKR